MKLRTINAVICKKFDAWVETITDEGVREKVKEGTICTGGAIASMLLNEKINDFDFYFRNRDTTLAVAQYYAKAFLANPPKRRDGTEVKIYVQCVSDSNEPEKERVKIIVKSAGVASSEGDEQYGYFEGDPDQSGVDYIQQVLENAESAKEQPKEGEKEKAKFRPVFMSGNAISLSDDVQLVVRFYGEPDQIHANYDFVHVTNYWTSWERKVEIRKDALLALMNKDLRYVGSRYPLCSLFRVRKFLDRGWKITAGQILKIAVNLQKFDLLEVGTLEEQLTGVDVAYFNDLINRIKAEAGESGKAAKDLIESGKFSVDSSYLGELIDRLF